MPIVNIEITEEQANALARGEPVTITPKKPVKKWGPQLGMYFVDTDGQVRELPSNSGRRLFGVEYPTREKAERASALMRPHNRLVAYALEHWPEYKVSDDPQQNWTVAYDVSNREWCAAVCYTTRVPWMPYGPKEKVDELVSKLNSGEVEL